MAQTFVVTNIQKGNFDGLVDFLKRVAYEDTPFLNACGTAKAIATLHKWASEDLNDAKANARTEGFTPTFAAADVKKRALESNEVQILSREFSFSTSQENVKKAGGIVSDYENEKQKKFKEIALDLDRALLIETEIARDADAGTASAMGGVINKITVTRDMSNSIISADIYDDFVQTIVDGGANPSAVWCAGFNRRVISGWAAPHRSYNDAQKTMTNVVLKYDGSWGTQDIMYDKHISASRLAILKMDCMKVAYLGDPLEHVEQSKGTIDGRRGYVRTEATLQHGSFKAGGIMTNTATAG